MTSVLIGRGENTLRPRKKGKAMQRQRQREECHKPSNIWGHQKLEEVIKYSPLELSEAV